MVEHPQIHEKGDTQASKKTNASKRKDESNTNEGQKKGATTMGIYPRPNWGGGRGISTTIDSRVTPSNMTKKIAIRAGNINGPRLVFQTTSPMIQKHANGRTCAKKHQIAIVEQ